MGMSASQARFLCLTARKNNVEFEGQQINQQRTTLSNESASYYSELCNMAVPVPPSIDDYTKVSYTFNDGAMTNTVTSLLYSSTEDAYHVNYMQQWQDDYSIVPSSSSLVQVSTTGSGMSSYIGSVNGAMASISMASPEALAASGSTTTYSIGGVTLRLLGSGAAGSSGSSVIEAPTEAPTTAPTEAPTEAPTTAPSTKDYVDVDGDGTGDYEVFYDDDGNPYYTPGGGGLTAYERSMIKFFYQLPNGSPELVAFVGNDGRIYRDDDIWQTGSIYVDDNMLKTSNSIIIATEDESQNVSLLKWDGSDYVKIDDDGNELNSSKVYITDPSTIIKVPTGNSYIASVNNSSSASGLVDELDVIVEEDADYIPEDQGIPYTAPSSYNASVSTSGDDYWNSLSSEDQTKLIEVEKYYLALLREYCGDSNAEFYVMYRKNSTTGAYDPYFYSKNELEATPATDRGLKSVAAYSIGSETKTKEVLNQTCSVEQDSSGRYVSLTVSLDSGEKKTYQLNTITTTDEEAYNDAMNDYYYQQHEYDHKIQEINAKLEIIQQQDKQLELKLKQLDTEENAISTEMDAVKKVISKNIDNSFKTFSA